MSAVTRRVSTRVLLLFTAFAVVLSSAVVSAAPASAADTGAIAGTVTDAEGSSVQGVVVTASTDDGPLWDATTGIDGSYLLTGLPAGDYTVHFDGTEASAEVASGWWEDAATRAGATVVTVGVGETADVSPQLAPGASISGRIIDGDGNPLEQATVWVSRADDENASTSVTTDADGDYRVRALPAGDYVLMITYWEGTTSLTEWWDNAQSDEFSTPITLAIGQSVSGVDVTLSPDDNSILDTHTGKLSGVLRNGAGEPIAGAWVGVMDAGGRFGDTVVTDADGKWSMNRLSVGSYKIEFSATVGGEEISEYWDNAPDFESATVITLADGEQRTDLDAFLGPDPLPAIPDAPTPTVSGSAVVGATVSAGIGVWSDGTTLTLKWLANGTPIPGATDSTFTVTGAQLGKKLSIRVTGTLDGFSTTSKTSAPTASVKAGTLTAPTPKISGTVAVGATLTAQPGTWTPGTAKTYQWLANGTPISKATKSTYKIPASLEGKRLTVRVTGKLAGYTTIAKTSSSTKKVMKAGTPALSGSAVVGATLTAKPGSWTAGTSFSYQWKADGLAIAKATKSTYKIPASMSGKKLSVTVTGKKSGYATVVKTSSPTKKVMKVGAVTISGTAAAGSTLTAKTSSWTINTTYSYQWKADGKAISKATKSTYKVSSSLAGKAITVTVTGRKSGHATAAKTSKATLRVPQAGKPSIGGTRYVTGTLTASPGVWTPGTSASYQWYANGTKISGATGSTLYLGSDSFSGKNVTVAVTGRKAGFTTVTTKSSAVTIKPAKAKPKSTYTCPPGYPIKGNKTTRHSSDWIYHVPGGQYYDATAPEECFVSELAAQRAGYRKSMR